MGKVEKLREVKKRLQERISDLETKAFIQNDSISFEIVNETVSQKTLTE